MTKDGQEPLRLNERIRNNMDQRLQEMEKADGAMQRGLKKLEESLIKSSRDVLMRTERSIQEQLTGLETQVSQKLTALKDEIEDLEMEPRSMLRRTAIISALVGGLVAMIPWGILTWAGIHLSDLAMQRQNLVAELVRVEERIEAVSRVEVIHHESGMYLLLPATAETGHTCGPGNARVPCLRLGD